MKKVLITGGCGFVGHHFVEHFLKNTDWEIVILDKLTYASQGFDRVRDINAFDDKRVLIMASDLAGSNEFGFRRELRNVNYILHLAAESHVDRSISDPIPFVKSNVLGTVNLLQFAINLDSLDAFVYFSTDEVFGPAPKGVNYKEWDRYNCTNPYSASKASGEEFCLAFANTYNIPLFITHCMNIFGERQHPEKFIPMCVRKILNGERITIHADKSLEESGSRFYIHARNVADAVHFLLDKFTHRDKYNIIGEKEISNLDLALKIGNILDRRVRYEMVDFHSSRPGHDLRYALDGSKMNDLGWNLPMNLDETLEKTIRWMVRPNNVKWL